mmetsp:Transcript_14693/g.37181  ORF Transcript_14693/g.37181 Transcript_14693/m.37181 type:complete len:245 (-) Transcript_14693:105-839(-)
MNATTSRSAKVQRKGALRWLKLGRPRVCDGGLGGRRGGIDASKCSCSCGAAARRRPQSVQCNAQMEASDAKALVAATQKIKQHGREGRPKLAITTLADLASQGIQPDKIAATAVIDACISNNKMDLAEGVFRELFGGVGGVGGGSGASFLEPDELTYAVLIKGYGHAGRWSKIRQTLRLMQDAGVDLTTATYNTLLEICVDANDPERGMEVLDEMAEREVFPDHNTIDIVKRRKMLRAHCKKVF